MVTSENSERSTELPETSQPHLSRHSRIDSNRVNRIFIRVKQNVHWPENINWRAKKMIKDYLRVLNSEQRPLASGTLWVIWIVKVDEPGKIYDYELYEHLIFPGLATKTRAAFSNKFTCLCVFVGSLHRLRKRLWNNHVTFSMFAIRSCLGSMKENCRNKMLLGWKMGVCCKLVVFHPPVSIRNIFCISPPVRWGLLDFMSVSSPSPSPSPSPSRPPPPPPPRPSPASAPRCLSVASMWCAGPQPRSCEFSVACRTPTAILWVRCGVPDPNRDPVSSVWRPGPQPPGDMSGRMSGDMSERYVKKNARRYVRKNGERYVRKNVRTYVRKNDRRYVRKNVRRYVRRNVRKICQKECQKICQKDVRKNVRRYVRRNVKRYVRKNVKRYVRKNVRR